MSSSHPIHMELKHPTFTLFSLLAPELRLKIWQYACTSRTISLRYVPEKDMCLSGAKPPAVLQTCHESRSEALRTYTLSFSTHTSPARIYFNPYLDTLYLPRHRQMGYDDTLRDFRSLLHPDSSLALNNLGSIALDHVDVQIKRPWEAYNKTALLRTLPKLEEVLLVLCEAEQTIGLGELECLVEPRRDPVELLRTWVEFRQSVVVEEKVLEDVCTMMEAEYVRWQLPSVRLRSKGKSALAYL